MNFVKWVRTQLDRSAAIVMVAAGAIALVLGYVGVRDELYPAGQLPYIASGGVFGLALIAVGTALWLSADLHDEWCELDEILEVLRETAVAASSTPTARAEVAPEAPATARPPRSKKVRVAAGSVDGVGAEATR